jgi:hypothetical protein
LCKRAPWRSPASTQPAGFFLFAATKSRLAIYKAAQADFLKQLRPPWLRAPVFIGSVWHRTPPPRTTERNPSRAHSGEGRSSSPSKRSRRFVATTSRYAPMPATTFSASKSVSKSQRLDEACRRFGRPGPKSLSKRRLHPTLSGLSRGRPRCCQARYPPPLSRVAILYHPRRARR